MGACSADVLDDAVRAGGSAVGDRRSLIGRPARIEREADERPRLLDIAVLPPIGRRSLELIIDAVEDRGRPVVREPEREWSPAWAVVRTGVILASTRCSGTVRELRSCLSIPPPLTETSGV
jgi:hypothetical protein